MAYDASLDPPQSKKAAPGRPSPGLDAPRRAKIAVQRQSLWIRAVDQVIGQIRFATAPYLLKPAGSLADGIFAMALVITLCGDRGWAPTRRRRNNGRR